MTPREAATERLAAVLTSAYRDGYCEAAGGEPATPNATLANVAYANTKWLDEPSEVQEEMRHAAQRLLTTLGAVFVPDDLLERVRRVDEHKCDSNCGAGECPSTEVRVGIADAALEQLQNAPRPAPPK